MRPPNSRHRDPALERALPDAALMLEACALVDASVDAAVGAAREAGRRVACGPGRTACCRQPIPVTPLELLIMRARMRFGLAPDIRASPESAAPQAWLASVTVPLQRVAWN